MLTFLLFVLVTLTLASIAILGYMIQSLEKRISSLESRDVRNESKVRGLSLAVSILNKRMNDSVSS
jgi:hypothetical protein